jgi:hypothetical protein
VQALRGLSQEMKATDRKFAHFRRFGVEAGGQHQRRCRRFARFHQQ